MGFEFEFELQNSQQTNIIKTCEKGKVSNQTKSQFWAIDAFYSETSR